MSKTILRMGAGVLALALTVTALPAMAQTTYSGPSSSPGEPHAMIARSDWGGVRAARQGDNDPGVISLSEFNRRFPTQGEAGFRKIFDENRSACSETGGWIRESLDIQHEAARLGLDTDASIEELRSLGGQLRRAAWIRSGANVLGTAALCAMSSGWYCGASALFAVGNEVTGRAHSNQAEVNRRQSLNSAELTKLNTRAMILHTRMNIGWANMVQHYCLTYHADNTLGM